MYMYIYTYIDIAVIVGWWDMLIIDWWSLRGAWSLLSGTSTSTIHVHFHGHGAWCMVDGGMVVGDGAWDSGHVTCIMGTPILQRTPANSPLRSTKLGGYVKQVRSGVRRGRLRLNVGCVAAEVGGWWLELRVALLAGLRMQILVALCEIYVKITPPNYGRI
jgi:hypothetical protein